MASSPVDSKLYSKLIPQRLCVLCCFYTQVTEETAVCLHCETHMCADCVQSEQTGLIFCSLHCANGGVVDTPDSLCLV